MAGKSKFFRVALEGDTTDGRKIERGWIEQMARTFNRDKYGARVWLEHFRGIFPDSPFKAYGDVLAVKAEEVDIDGVKKLGLFAQIDPTSDLVTMNKDRQKIYTSCEIDPNFANTGEAYLVGLAVTDSPASLGTEMLAFSATAATNPLAARKLRNENLFTAAQEVTLEFEPETAKPQDGDTLFNKVKGLLGLKAKTDETRFADIGQAVETVALSQKETLDRLAELSAQLKQQSDTAAAQQKAFADLQARLEREPAAGNGARPAATGTAGAPQTDC